MLEKRHLILVVVLVSYLSCVICRKETIFLECDPTKASAEKSNNECPENSQCVELGKNISSTNTSVSISTSYGGLCACKFNYMVNNNYTSSDNNSLYCIEPAVQISNTTKTTALPIVNVTATTTAAAPIKETTSTVKPTLAPAPTNKTESIIVKPSNESQSKNANDKQHEQQQQQKGNVSAQAHHILGGIILPVMIVLAFIGLVYGVRKYDVLDRAQNYIRNRRVGQSHQTRYDGLENDFDDDPLLI